MLTRRLIRNNSETFASIGGCCGNWKCNLFMILSGRRVGWMVGWSGLSLFPKRVGMLLSKHLFLTNNNFIINTGITFHS